MKERLVIGIIRTSYGINGFVKVKSISGECNHFMKLNEVYIRKRSTISKHDIEEVTTQGNDLLLKFKGIDSPEKAKELNGAEILVPREDACHVEEDEFYYGDLCDCRIVFDGQVIGEIRSVIDSGPVSLLEIKKIDGKTVLIPFTKKYIGHVDITGCTVELIKEAGLY